MKKFVGIIHVSTLVTRLDQIRIQIARVWVLNFTQQEWKRRGARTCLVAVTGRSAEDGGLGTWCRAEAAATAAQSSPAENALHRCPTTIRGRQIR